MLYLLGSRVFHARHGTRRPLILLAGPPFALLLRSRSILFILPLLRFGDTIFLFLSFLTQPRPRVAVPSDTMSLST